jgi:HPr kinase/phosphorylase
VGYLNYIHPYRVQIWASARCAYLANATPEDCARRIARIVTLEPPVLMLADGQTAPDALMSMCERAQIPMFATKRVVGLRDRRAARLPVQALCRPHHDARRVHGHSGPGGADHRRIGPGQERAGAGADFARQRLVADDAVDLYRINQTTIEGRCPELLQNLLEVRGIGLLDIRAIFGETAVRRKMRLKLIVHLVRKETLERDYERLPYEPLTQDMLGIPVRKAVIQVVAGRNIAVLVEAAVRNTILQLRGVDTYQEFVERHRRPSIVTR